MKKASKPEPSNIEVAGSGTTKLLVALTKVALALVAWTRILSVTLNVESGAPGNATGAWLVMAPVLKVISVTPSAVLSYVTAPVPLALLVADPLKLSPTAT